MPFRLGPSCHGRTNRRVGRIRWIIRLRRHVRGVGGGAGGTHPALAGMTVARGPPTFLAETPRDRGRADSRSSPSATPISPANRPRPLLTLTTDFGTKDF